MESYKEARRLAQTSRPYAFISIALPTPPPLYPACDSPSLRSFPLRFLDVHGHRPRRGEAMLRPYHDDARVHLLTAKEMIAKMGYHRRDKEVEELEKQLK